MLLKLKKCYRLNFSFVLCMFKTRRTVLERHYTETVLASVMIQEPDSILSHPFRCSRCSRIFKSNSYLRKHILLQHETTSKECYNCFYSCENRECLKKHFISHFDGCLFCDFCAVRFKSCSNLLKHINDHLQQMRKFSCALCNKEFASKVSLKMHLLIHNKEKTFKCSYCCRSFSQLSSKQYHEKVHTNTSSHFCAFCNEGFKSKTSKDTHERIHTGERPFECNECHSSFRSLMLLRQHNIVHSSETKYECRLCSKKFKRNEKLRIHIRTHTGEKPFSCQVCGKYFSSKSDTSRHVRLVHSKSLI